MRCRLIFTAIACLFFVQSSYAAQAQTTAKASQAASIAVHVSGPFDVKVTPAGESSPGIARMTLDKQFHGKLEATSKGEMLASGGTQGTGGYVAMEMVTGTLDGRKGSFALQHSGTMVNNSFSLNIVVVPGSGTGELAGIDGKMNILIASDGKHSYDFEYTLPAK